MKKLIYITLSFLTLNAAAVEFPETTTLKVYEDATVEQMTEASELLQKAIAARKDGDHDSYISYLTESKKILNKKNKSVKSFKAAFNIKYNHSYVNYFESSDATVEGDFKETCFVGTTRAAKALLQAAIKANRLNFDEEWFENPVIKNSKLYIDYIDGPNDYHTTVEIKSCL
ncbi:hypothetical protein M899_2705 [Bacteriovorax sp. BSW11_IV]|uniref:hypothetical protein n=1 Tax=Bacteriovorax sp. BSW11_IV TaxID=1353529 RepID=UPI00038A181C|nr:hypothetical protein [Bacteriovorax sp. BSW11_IV]EQC49970.1 hypothetical protein M899_2705 [Bacteriovorax sp. BSW11_IV]